MLFYMYQNQHSAPRIHPGTPLLPFRFERTSARTYVRNTEPITTSALRRRQGEASDFGPSSLVLGFGLWGGQAKKYLVINLLAPSIRRATNIGQWPQTTHSARRAT